MDVHQCKKCGKSFALKSNLVKHKKVHTHDRLHQCTLCDKNYKYKCNLSYHVKTAHSTGAKPFVCKEPQCSYSSYLLSGLKNHVRKVHQGGKKNTPKPFDCIICGKTFWSRVARDNHILAVHTNERLFPCTICGRAFNTKSHLKRHFETHSGLKPYKCTKCSSSFATKGVLHNHDKVVHIKARIHPCNLCDKMCITTGDRNKHIASHLRINEKLQKCKQCGKCYASLTGLKYHINYYHGKEKRVSCSKCPKTFNVQSQLNAHVLEVHCKVEDQCLFCERKANIKSVFMRHIQTHLRERFYCKQCPKSFFNTCSLIAHLKDHPQICKSKNEQTLYSCRKKQCSFECKKLTEFNKHVQVVHKSERPFRCELCAKSFATRQNLDAHTRSHLDEKPYQCSICKIRYRKSESVKYCLDRHHNIRRFKCNVCLKAFTRQHELRNHYLSIHADPQERRHCCIFCGKRYVKAHLFNLHLQMHTRERPHICEQCPTEFRKIEQLNKHTKTHHKL